MTAVLSACIKKKKLPKLVNFCIAILILKMEEKSNISGILCFIILRKVKTQKKICAVYGAGAVTDQTCQKWFAKFRAGDFSLDVAPQSGRPVEVHSDQIETLIENDQRYTTREIANLLKISKSSVENHLYQLGYVNRFDVWVPHKLNEEKPS